MNDTAQLDELFVRWEEAHEQGVDVTPEQLCLDCPDLLDPLRQKIAELGWVDQLLDLHPAADDSTGTGEQRVQGPLTDTTQDGDRQQSEQQRPVPRTLGRYRLDELVGVGGFGQVWKGDDPELDRVVAIKVLRPELHASVVQVGRFLDEAKKVARLRHPNTVSVHDVGRDQGFCFIVSDFIDGMNLSTRMKTGKIPGPKITSLVAKVADALHHAHQHGIIHRDVKPQNILLDRDEEPYLTDFGIAVTAQALRDGDTDVSGTPAYMSPEQAKIDGPPLDVRTDVYSLGVVLYELLVAKRPYEASSVQILRQRFDAPTPPSPRSIDASVPAELDTTCMKAIAVDPGDRWGDSHKFAEALRQVYRRDASRSRVVAVAVLAALVIVVSCTSYWIAVNRHASTVDPSMSSTLMAPEERTDSIYDDALVHYTFDEDTVSQRDGELFVRDLSPAGNHGLGKGVEVVPDGVHGNALALKGGYLRLPRMFLNKRREYTLAFWIFRERPPDEIQYAEFTPEGDDLYHMDDNTWVNAWNAKAAPDLWIHGFATAEPLPFQQWAFFGGVFKANDGYQGKIRVFVDDRSFEVDSHMVDCDRPGYGQVQGKSGRIDELVIYDRALTDPEMHALYELGRKKQEPSTASQQHDGNTPAITGVGGRRNPSNASSSIRGSGQKLGKPPVQATAKDDDRSILEALCVQSPSAVKPIPPNPILYMTFDEGTVGQCDRELFVRDLSPAGNHGVGEGVEVVPSGISGNALAFKDGEVRMPRLTLDRRREFTIAFWIFPMPGGHNVSYSEYHDNGRVQFTFNDVTFFNAWNMNTEGNWVGGMATSEPLPEGRWSFLAEVFKADAEQRGKVQVFVDGKRYELQGQMVDHGDPGYASISGKSGKIDEFLLYNRALSDAEIDSLYKKGQSELARRSTAQQPARSPDPATVESPTSAFSATSVEKLDEDKSLLLHMTFDEGTVRNHEGSLIVDDLSGAGNNGVGENVEVVPGGVHGNALAFVPHNPQASERGFVRLPRMLLKERREYTVAFWLTRTGDEGTAYEEFDATGDVVYTCSECTLVNAWNKHKPPDCWGGGFATTDVGPIGRWSFLACAFKADNDFRGKARVFVDDRPFQVDTQTIDNEHIGYAKFQGASGRIDELRIYGRALSDTEIRSLYERGRAELARHAK